MLQLAQQLHHREYPPLNPISNEILTWNDIQGLITPPLVQNTGFGAYTFFAVFCLLAFVWTFFFVPETKGRTLEQMDHVFKDNSSEAEEARRHAIEVELLRAEAERYAMEA